MKIDMLGVQAFVAIADTGGFQRAAGTLNITQAALSRRLQTLEGFLGVKLVERTTRAMALTRIGENFLPQARRLMTDLSAALVEIRVTPARDVEPRLRDSLIAAGLASASAAGLDVTPAGERHILVEAQRQGLLPFDGMA